MTNILFQIFLLLSLEDFQSPTPGFPDTHRQLRLFKPHLKLMAGDAFNEFIASIEG